MPLFVDGVEIAEVWVDGVEQDSVWADGVEVFTAGGGFEDYADDFVDTIGLATQLHQMNTGQFWNVQVVSGTATIQLAVNDPSKYSSYIDGVGALTFQQELSPIVELVNPSFIAEASFGWSPVSGFQHLISVGLLSSLVGPGGDTSMGIFGIFGSYSITMTTNGVSIYTVAVPVNSTSCKMTMYFDGTDIAGVFVVQPSGSRYVVPRQSNQGAPNIIGRGYASAYSPTAGFGSSWVYDVSEVGVNPINMPWPS